MVTIRAVAAVTVVFIASTVVRNLVRRRGGPLIRVMRMMVFLMISPAGHRTVSRSRTMVLVPIHPLRACSVPPLLHFMRGRPMPPIFGLIRPRVLC